MRHRRGAFSNERKFHGNDRRESRNDYRERGRFRDDHLYRDREPGYSLYENRYNHEPRYSERPTAFDHINRCPRERTDNTEKFASTEASGAAFKEYLKNKYNGPPVSANVTNTVDSAVNNRNAAQSLNNQNIVNRVHDNGVGNCSVPNQQTILENRTQREHIRIFVPRSGSVRNDRFQDQALLNHDRIPSPRQRPAHHVYPDRTSFRHQGGDPDQKTNLDWNRNESTNHWDLRQNCDQVRTLGINATADPLKYNGLYDEPQRQTDLLKQNLWIQPVGKLENRPVFKNSKIIGSLEFHSAQDQVHISRQDSAKSRSCEPVTVSSTYIRNTSYRNAGMAPTRSEQLGVYPYSDKHTVFAQGGEPITRREILPSNNHPRPMRPPTFLKHNYERAGVVIGPELCSDVRTSWHPPPVPVYTTPSHRPNDQFRPVHLADAIDSLSHGNKGPRILYTQSTENISVALPRDGILQPAPYDSSARIPRVQAGIIPDVTMIPLPPPPPPPPPPPNYSKQQPSHTIPSVPIATPPCTQSEAVTESQKPSSIDTSVNQVSSTSADFEQISSTSEEPDHSEDIKSFGADEQDILDETKLLGVCDKAKENLQDLRKEKASEEKNKNRLASERDVTDFQLSSSEEMKYTGHHFDKQCSTMGSINNAPVKSLNQPEKGLPVSNAYYTENIDSNTVVHKHDFKYGDENKVRNQTAKLGRIYTQSGEIRNRLLSETFETVEDTRLASENNGIQWRTAKYNLDQQNQQQEVPSFYKQGWVGPGGTDQQFTRNIKEPFRKDPPIHRPWQVDVRKDRRERMFNSEFNYNIRDRDYTSFESSYRQRPYARPCNERRRLSGLGIHTYPSHLDNQSRRFSNLGHFRPWEKHRSRWDRIKDDGSQNIEDRSANFQHVAPVFRSDLFPDQSGERFWHDDFRVTTDGNRKQVNSTEGSKWKNNGKDLKNAVENTVDCSLNMSDSWEQEQKTSGQELNQECAKEVLFDRQQNFKVKESSDKVAKEKRSLEEQIDCQKEIESSVQEAKMSHSKTDKIPPGCPNDSFAKKRQDRYNHGHSYSEIVAVKIRNDQDKKVQEDVRSGKSEVHMSVKNLNGEEATKNNCELKGVQRLDKKALFGSSKDLYPPSTIAMPILSILGSAISKVNSKRKLSKIAKPDISLENTLLKSELKHSNTKLGSYKIPLLKRNKEESKNIKDNFKLEIMSVEKKVDNSHASKEQKSELSTSDKLKSQSIHKDKKKCETQKGKKTEKAEKKRKHRVKSDKEHHTAIDLKSLHPKLRHKIAPSSIDSKEKELRIVVEKCKIGHKSVDKSEVTISSENKCIRRNAPDKDIENKVEILKQKPSSLMRGKFVLSTPNTYVVKETKKPKPKEKTLDNSNSGNSASVTKESLDKAMFSAKKYLLYRALAINALTRDKTKPLVEKKPGKRKSVITTDMAKQELEYLEETLATNLEKYEVDKDENNYEKKDENNAEKKDENNNKKKDHEKDENNNEKKDENSNDISTNEKLEGVYENHVVQLDLPSTEYKPQRTAIGNYAAQCLFGPIVSSTYYKAPGKARVIRNSKETFAGYTKCPEYFGVKDAAMINTDMNKTSGSGSEGIVSTVNTSEPSPLIDVVTVSCNVSPSGSVALTEKLELNSSHVDTLKKVTNKEGIYEIQQVEDQVNVSPSEAEFETCNRQIENSTRDNLDKAVETGRCRVEQQAWLPHTLLNPFPHSPSNIFSASDQLEMHKKYLQAKQEITASCESYAELKSDPIPVLPSLLPTFPVTTLTASVLGNSQQLPVCRSSLVHGPNTVGLNPAHASITEHKISESSPVETETVTETENSLTDATCGSGMQYEPSNEEFEMYRDYQIKRVAAYTNSEGQKSPYCLLNEFPKWKGEAEKLEDLERPCNNDEFEDDNQWRTEKYETEGLCMSDETISEPRPSIRSGANIGENISGNLYNSLPLEENRQLDQESPFQYPAGRDLLQQKASCDIINIDQELQDTSKNMFEDLVTDILTDTDLISSIPINPPDITREVSLTNVSEEFAGTPAPGGNYLQHTSPQIPTLSPKAGLNEVQNYSELHDVIRDEKSNVFKSARAPLHLGASRKPRFEKRFPKPLPRAKPQKTINAEKELYMAAERFLGDFDNSNKRSCCKGNFELLINPVTGKMESVKTAKNEEHAVGQNTVKSENVESLDKNMAANINCDSSQLEKPCDVNDIQTKTMSEKSKDSNVVTRQQLAMKKLILRPKGQQLRKRSKVVYANKSKYNKGHARGKESKQSNIKKIQEKRIPSIRLKTVKETNSSGKTTVEKWQNVTQKLDTDEKSKNTIEKRQKDLLNSGSDEKRTSKTVLKERSKNNTEKHKKDSLKTVLNVRNKNSTERCQKHSPRHVENKGKIKANEDSKKHKPTSSATSKPTSSATSKPTSSATSKPTSGATSKQTSSATIKPTSSATSKPTSGATSKPTSGATSKPTSGATSKPTRQVESSSQKDDLGQQVKDILLKQLCKLCTFSCNSLPKLKIHYSRNHVNWCLQCRKHFKDPESCRYHISQSHNAAVWCEVCGSTFSHRPNYDRHLKSMFHQENVKWIEFIKKEGEKKRTLKETVLISDDDGSAVEIIEDLSKNGNETNGTEDTVNEAVGRKMCKTKGMKSPDVNVVTSRKRKHPEFIDEDDVDAKKVNSIQYCNVCKQYYKKMRAHLATKKHEEMVKEWQELKAKTSNGEDGILAWTVEDSDHDMSIHIDDDTQEEDVETLSDSSGKSVFIVSDHDCSFEYESDDCKAVITGEDGSAFMRHGYDVQFENLDPSHSLGIFQPEACRELCLGPDPNNLIQSGESDKTMKGESFDSKMDVVNADDRSVPVIVSTWKEQICSPTLLVKNIAADLMCKGDSKDVQQNIFESMSSEQKCFNESGRQCNDSDQEIINDFDSKGCDTREVCAIKSCIKEDMDVDSESELEKNIIHEQALGEIDGGSEETTERVAEVVKQVEMERETIKEEPEDIANVTEESNITDYEVIENPCSPEDYDLSIPK